MINRFGKLFWHYFTILKNILLFQPLFRFTRRSVLVNLCYMNYLGFTRYIDQQVISFHFRQKLTFISNKRWQTAQWKLAFLKNTSDKLKSKRQRRHDNLAKFEIRFMFFIQHAMPKKTPMHFLLLRNNIINHIWHLYNELILKWFEVESF